MGGTDSAQVHNFNCFFMIFRIALVNGRCLQQDIPFTGSTLRVR